MWPLDRRRAFLSTLTEGVAWMVILLKQYIVHLYLQGLEVIESTNLRYFTKEMTAEFYALKGMFLAQIGR